ncbi:MAG TPA: glycosyltransferase [Gemmatimonadaceae bacterium]|nr:glycosyltransferase [Gemmatimonadaceae bacterium]
MRPAPIAVVLSGYPRRSETFAVGELLALDARGVLAAIFATRAGDGSPPLSGSERLTDRMVLLEPASEAEQGAAIAAHLAGKRVSSVHGYFAHHPAAVAAEAARRMGVPFGFSVHARDARKIDAVELGRRARAAACVVACNADVAADVRAAGGDVELIPHGVDLARFQPLPSPPGERLRILAVGRLVEKKGFDVLIAAMALLRIPAELRIIGEGPERARLEAEIAQLGLQRHVHLCGSRAHHELPAEYAAAHVIAVPSVRDASGDRDGVPNVLLEAMACGRPVVASDAGAIVSAVVPGVTGMLVPAGDTGALAQALTVLAGNGELRARLAARARAEMEHRFDLRACTERFCGVLEAAYA